MVIIMITADIDSNEENISCYMYYKDSIPVVLAAILSYAALGPGRDFFYLQNLKTNNFESH